MPLLVITTHYYPILFESICIYALRFVVTDSCSFLVGSGPALLRFLLILGIMSGNSESFVRNPRLPSIGNVPGALQNGRKWCKLLRESRTRKSHHLMALRAVFAFGVDILKESQRISKNVNDIAEICRNNQTVIHIESHYRIAMHCHAIKSGLL